MRQTQQRIAEFESKLARLKERERKDRTREMILVGATMLAEAERGAGFRRWLISKLEAAMKPADEALVRRLIERIERQAVQP
jgi:hypothetical protein